MKLKYFAETNIFCQTLQWNQAAKLHLYFVSYHLGAGRQIAEISDPQSSHMVDYQAP